MDPRLLTDMSWRDEWVATLRAMAGASWDNLRDSFMEGYRRGRNREPRKGNTQKRDEP
jgi:hypothetical protein